MMTTSRRAFLRGALIASGLMLTRPLSLVRPQPMVAVRILEVSEISMVSFRGKQFGISTTRDLIANDEFGFARDLYEDGKPC